MPNFSGIWTATQQMQAKGQGIWPALPGAPTIGTATATGSTTATVAFTAPANTGYPATLTYTATSSPGGLTGTGSSSPITVTGLTAATSYTFTVVATNASGTSPASAASNSITTTYTIGQSLGGGYYAGQISTAGNGIADYNLVIAPKASGQTTVNWKNTNTATAGADSVINGPQNTIDMVIDGSSTVYPAAHFCNDLSTGGQTDWYMPAQNELEVVYFNLKPAVVNNATNSGINPNSVPPKTSNYTIGNPAQTSATIFRSGGGEDFDLNNYWSSSEFSASTAVTQEFYNGYQQKGLQKDGGGIPRRVRAIRRIAV